MRPLSPGGRGTGSGGIASRPVAPRYPQALAMLGAPAKTDESPIPLKATHAVKEAADVYETLVRGAAKRQIGAGQLVTVVKIEDGYAKIAQEGALLGYIEETKLLKLNWNGQGSAR